MKSQFRLHLVLAYFLSLSNNWLTAEANPGFKSTSSKEPFQKDGYYAGKQISAIIDKLEIMESRIDLLEKDLDKKTELLEGLHDAANADQNFWNSSDSCGGAVVAQTGKLSAFSTFRRKCSWTISANHRSQIKINLNHISTDGIPYNHYIRKQWRGCEVFELIFGVGGPGGPQSLKRTKITYTNTYVFRGPIIFVSCYIVADDRSNSLTFEGTGPLIHTNVVFANFGLQLATGSFDLTSPNREIPPNTSEYTTLLVSLSNLGASKLYLQNNFHPQCNNNFSLYLYQNFTDSSAPIFNCCEMDCQRKQFLVMDQFFLATISAPYTSNNASANCKLLWEPVEHSSLSEEPSSLYDIYEYGLMDTNPQKPSGTSCGGIISGKRDGRISVIVNQNNKRCIWAIRPYPKNTIEIYVSENSLVDSNHDYFAAVEIDREEPITTRLVYGKYNFTGRVIIIMLYTDNTIPGGVFRFNWKSIGSTDLVAMSDDTKLFRSTQRRGNASFNTRLWSPITNMGFHTFVINPQGAGPHSLNLTINEANLEGIVKLRILGCKNSNFTNVFESEETVVRRSFESLDGFFVLVLEIQEDSSNGSFKISWEQGESTLLPQYESCGGTLDAETGTINYKVETKYPYNDRCVWILHCPYESVTLNLRKSGLVCCNDSLLVDLIDLNDGTILLNQTSVLSSENQTQTFVGPLLILTFQSDSYTRGTGFELDFRGSGSSFDRSHRFRMLHNHEMKGSFMYPLLEDPLKPDEMLILGYSEVSKYERAYMVKGSPPSRMILNLKIDSDLEDRRFNTDVEHLNIYSHFIKALSLQPAVKCSISSGALKDACEFNAPFKMQSFTNSLNTSIPDDSLGIQFDIYIKYSAFLITYKPASSSIKPLAFNLTWADDDACGGIEIGESGEIEYKVSQGYRRNEHCIWIIESPDKNSIRFTMISYGLDACDRVQINAIDPEDGTLGNSREFSRGNMTVVGSTAIVTFFSISRRLGTGFKLIFAGIDDDLGEVEENKDSFIFRLIQERNYGAGNNELSVPSLSQVPMRSNEILVLTFNPTPTKLHDWIHYNSTGNSTTILFQNLKMFVNENCTTDSLRFYTHHSDVRRNGYNNYYCYGGSYVLSKSLRSYSSSGLCNRNQSEFDPNYEHYDYEGQASICDTECYNIDILSNLLGQSIELPRAPFIAIYKSVTDQTNDQKVVQFKWEKT